jgi:hypothetical protein
MVLTIEEIRELCQSIKTELKKLKYSFEEKQLDKSNICENNICENNKKSIYSRSIS